MGQDTRKDPRAKVLSLTVRYKSATVDEFIEHHSHDISKGGIFIKTPSPFPAGTLLKFEIRIKDDSPLIAGVGRVVWKREPPQASGERPAGMGVKFIKLDGQSRELIDRVVAERKVDGPSFEETPDGKPPASVRPRLCAARCSAVPALRRPSRQHRVWRRGGAFFPASAGPPSCRRPQERTVIKQADEILAEALEGARLGGWLGRGHRPRPSPLRCSERRAREASRRGPLSATQGHAARHASPRLARASSSRPRSPRRSSRRRRSPASAPEPETPISAPPIAAHEPSTRSPSPRPSLEAPKPEPKPEAPAPMPAPQ